MLEAKYAWMNESPAYCNAGGYLISRQSATKIINELLQDDIEGILKTFSSAEAVLFTGEYVSIVTNTC